MLLFQRQEESIAFDLEGGFLRAWWFEPLLATGTYSYITPDRTFSCIGLFVQQQLNFFTIFSFFVLL